MNLKSKPTMSKRDLFISLAAAALFFIMILCLYAAVGSDAIGTHCAYDSYTLQAMAWRRGEVKLDQNYPYLELAIVNKEYFAAHGREDYQAYRETFGDVNAPIEDQEGNEYYVSFPPFPSVPMFFLTWIFGENTPNNLISVLYTAGAFFFALGIGRRLKFSYPIAACGAAFLCVASSALFLCANKMVGSVWFQAQNLSLLLTTGAFYFVLGGKRRDFYTAFVLLALAVGCRPFQLIYFLPFAYILTKKYHFKVLKTWSFYLPPAGIGAVYMWYNYIRFGNPLEFGHNYLPEFMRMPAGQFGTEYLRDNMRNAFASFPTFTGGTLQFGQFGFAFYIANVLFILLPLALLFRRAALGRSWHFSAEIGLLVITMTLHLLFLLLHKTLGGWQFGSRYTVDLMPAALTAVALALRPVMAKPKEAAASGTRLRPLFCGTAAVLLAAGSALNLYGAVKLF